MERSWRTNTRPSTGLPEAGAQCPLRLAHGAVDSLVYNRQIEINLLTVFFLLLVQLKILNVDKTASKWL